MKSKSKLIKKNGLVEPKEFTCFHCQKKFEVKYNNGIGMFSQKNYWLYWIDENWDYKQIRRKSEDERGDKVCDNCLKTIYLEKEWELLDQIKSRSRRQTLASYIYHKVI